MGMLRILLPINTPPCGARELRMETFVVQNPILSVSVVTALIVVGAYLLVSGLIHAGAWLISR